MENDILRVENITKKYGANSVLNGISFSVNRGDVYGLLGPNGVGKTTTLKVIVNMIQSDSGEIYLNGKLKRLTDPIHKHIGVAIENPCFYEHLSGYENLMIFAGLIDLGKERVNQVLDMFDLTPVKKRKVKQYSQGMKQRLAIARVFLNDPELIILDEPTNGLDPNGIRSMRELIQKLSKDYNKTIILSTHMLGEAAAICNRFGIISDGVIATEESMDAIRQLVGYEERAFEDYFIQKTEGGVHD